MSRPSCPGPLYRSSRPARWLGALLAVLALLACHVPALADTWTVTLNNDGLFAGTLRYAVVNANAGDNIVFDPSVTTIVLNGTSLPVTQDILINGAGSVTIDGNDASRIFTVQNASLALVGLTLTHGDSSDETVAEGFGGAIYLAQTTGSEALTILECTITACTGSLLGSGVIDARPSGAAGALTITVRDTSITNNGQSGLSFVSSEELASAQATIERCRFESNAGAGCILSPETAIFTATVNDSIFDDNGSIAQSLFHGGLSFGFEVSEYHATVTGCTFSNNEALGYGGGMGFYNINPDSVLVVDKSRFLGNVGSGGPGGMNILCDQGGQAKVTNCFFAANQAGTDGPAIYATITDGSQLRFTNNTVSANESSAGCAGVYFELDGTSTVYLDNDIIYGNTSTGSGYGKDILIDDDRLSQGSGGKVFIRYCIFGAASQDLVVQLGNQTTLTSNLTQDPKLRNTATGDLHLRANSPGIDAGRCAYLVDLGGIAYYNRIAPYDDIDGDPRPTGLTTFFGCDIGADEYTLHHLPLIMLLDE